MLTAVQHILWLNSNKKRNHCCTSTTMLSSFALTATSRLTIQWECNAAFTRLQSFHEGTTLRFISSTHIFQKAATSKLLVPKIYNEPSSTLRTHISDVTVQSLVTMATTPKKFVHPLHYSRIAHLVKYHK